MNVIDQKRDAMQCIYSYVYSYVADSEQKLQVTTIVEPLTTLNLETTSNFYLSGTLKF